jgi:ribosomal protein S18 acetylase RimI-like enzyme
MGNSRQQATGRPAVIRRAGRADVYGIALLWERAGLPRSRRGFHSELARLRHRDPELVLIALRDARIIGAIGGSYDGRTAVLSRLAVDEQVRGEGIGRLLVEALFQQLEGLGAGADELIVLDGSPAANAFWQAIGFERGRTAEFFRRAV